MIANCLYVHFVTATHELYTNVTDTVELRTCDIFFNPISCESISGFKVVNPRGFVYNDETHYKVEIYPNEFLHNDVEWVGTTPLMVTTREPKNLYVGLNTAKGQGEYFDNEISIQIPDYCETPPKFTVRVYNGFKTIKIKPIIIKYGDNQYINFGTTNLNLQTYEFYTSSQFYSCYTNQVIGYINAVNTTFRQAGINFVSEEPQEIIDENLFVWNDENNNDNFRLINKSNTEYNNTIVLYLTDAFVNNDETEKTFTDGLTLHSQRDNIRICYGCILTKYSDYATCPHEFGHALGLEDIYMLPSDLSDNIPSYGDLNSDFTGEINYYSRKIYEIIPNCVMFGDYTLNSSPILPLGFIRGKDTKAQVRLTNIGLNGIKSNVKTYGVSNEN